MKKTKLTLLMLAATGLVAEATIVGDYDLVAGVDSDKNAILIIRKYRGNDEVLTLPTEAVANGVTYPVAAIGDYAFEQNKTLREVKIPEPYQTIGKFAFAGTEITKMDLPASLKIIDKQAFVDMPLDTVICRAAVPPAAWCLNYSDMTMTMIWTKFGDIFHRIIEIMHKFPAVANYSDVITINDPSLDSYYDEMCQKYVNSKIEATLIVPNESMSLYKDATKPSGNSGEKFSYGPWSNFENYLALEDYPGAIDNIAEDTFDYNNNIYDISGRRLVQDYDGSSPLDLKPGIYIYKGKKVMIK